MRGACLIPLLLVVGCGGDPPFAHTFDPCEPTALAPTADATAAQLDAFRASIAMWRGAAGADLALEGDARAAGPVLPIHFVDTPLYMGRYDDQDAWIELQRGIPPQPLSIVLAHELGHAFGLVHVPPGERASVMNAGNFTVAPTAADGAAVAALWGSCKR